MRLFVWFLIFGSILCSPAFSRSQPVSCGTRPGREQEESYLHRQSMRLRKRAPAQASIQAAANRDFGEIAVIEDSDGVVARRNPFNLTRKTVRFLPAVATASRYRFETVDGGYDPDLAAAGTPITGLGDDDVRPFSLPFAFPFFGTSYRQIFIASDGNVTFGEAEPAAIDRTLGRLAAGPPRVAPLFLDLDPTRTPDGVRVLSDSTRFVVSWVAVREYSDFGFAPAHTFQLRLFPDGRIETSWSDVLSVSAVVGISPGKLQGATSIVSFLGGSSQEYSATLAERFGNSEEVDLISAAQRFYLTHEDSYDYLAFYNSLGVMADSSSGALSYELTLRNVNRSGYADPEAGIDIASEYGSPRRLQAVLNMGSLASFPTDPNGQVALRAPTPDTPLTILGHEAGHLFLAFVTVRDPDSPSALPMLGRQLFHWNFRFNSEASLLEGNRIKDNGAGTSPRFITTGASEGYAPLDQYLMGFRAPEEVPPTFYVRSNAPSFNSAAPQVGVTLTGERRDVAIDEIVAVAGRRIPDHTLAQRRFRVAFVLIVPAGSTPTDAELAKVETYRKQFEPAYARYSDNRAFVDATLRKTLTLSLAPAAGVMTGAEVTASVQLQTAAAAPLTVLLKAPGGNISVPSSVTIPAGATQVTFQARGLREGVEELSAEPADSRYETSYSRVQVSAQSRLKVIVQSGNGQTATAGTPLAQPVEFRVTDINLIPYPGVTVSASASTGGTLNASSAVTNGDGVVRFLWTPGPNATNELTALIDGGASAVATALGKPSFTRDSVLNAASFQPLLAPGSIAVIFGGNLLDGEVTVNGRKVQAYFSSNRQINFVLPLDTPVGDTDVAVTTSAGSSGAVRITLVDAAPGIFYDVPTGLGAAVDRGSRVFELYATGLGPVGSAGLNATASALQVEVGGQPAEVLFSGLAPGFPGLYQVNIKVADSVPAGTQPVTLMLSGRRSNEAKIVVR